MTFSYSGTVNISEGESVFGETASTVPVNVAFTYDTSLVTGPQDIIPAGTSLNGFTLLIAGSVSIGLESRISARPSERRYGIPVTW